MALVELDATVLADTAERLHRRIGERFPGSGLEQRADDLILLIATITRRAGEISQPIWWIRGLYLLVGLLVVVGLAAIPIDLSATNDLDTIEWIPFVESAVNDVCCSGPGSSSWPPWRPG